MVGLAATRIALSCGASAAGQSAQRLRPRRQLQRIVRRLDGRIYDPRKAFTNETLYFDITHSEWNHAAPRRAAAQGFHLVSYGNYLYAFGGLVHDQYSPSRRFPVRSLNIVERFDVTANKWKTIGKLPRPRSSYVLGHIGDKVYLIGGWDGLSDEFHSEIDVFDLATEKSTPSGHTLPDPLRRALAAVTVNDEIILVAGLGATSYSDFLANTTSFRPSATEMEQWQVDCRNPDLKLVLIQTRFTRWI